MPWYWIGRFFSFTKTKLEVVMSQIALRVQPPLFDGRGGGYKSEASFSSFHPTLPLLRDQEDLGRRKRRRRRRRRREPICGKMEVVPCSLAPPPPPPSFPPPSVRDPQTEQPRKWRNGGGSVGRKTGREWVGKGEEEGAKWGKGGGGGGRQLEFRPRKKGKWGKHSSEVEVGRTADFQTGKTILYVG